jgi:cytochrome b561
MLCLTVICSSSMFRKYSNTVKILSRSLRFRPFTSAATEAAPATVQRFARPLQWLHWIGAGGITFCTVSAVIAGQIPNDPAKTTKEKYALRQQLMYNHESVGILMLIALFPRVGARLLTKIPDPLPASSIEHLLAKLSHTFLYGALIFMPISGLAFGYFSCWGVPFFGVRISIFLNLNQNQFVLSVFFIN